VSAAVILALPIAGYLLGRFAARTTPATVHQRGTRIEDGRCAQHAARKRIQKDPTCITLAGVAVEPMDETKHFKLIGTTGSGKSTAIREVLRTALARGDRALNCGPRWRLPPTLLRSGPWGSDPESLRSALRAMGSLR
jgi:hypothetical protein